VKLLLVSINSRISGKQYSHGCIRVYAIYQTLPSGVFWQRILTSFVIIN